MSMFKYFRILGIKNKEKEFKILINNFFEQTDNIKKIPLKDFEKMGLNPNDIILQKQIEEYQRPLDFVKDIDIFKVEENTVYLLFDKEVRENLKKWLKNN